MACHEENLGSAPEASKKKKHLLRDPRYIAPPASSLNPALSICMLSKQVYV